ncbi:hypothetical protein BaRGS_00033111 [Batillaria attramentaria]|uniref:Uncharacterized protein n=1 Tax=Batillaria attramentaria TaxID=370345 RepID=A0ABD0J5R9_9CAEN
MYTVSVELAFIRAGRAEGKLVCFRFRALTETTEGLRSLSSSVFANCRYVPEPLSLRRKGASSNLKWGTIPEAFLSRHLSYLFPLAVLAGGDYSSEKKIVVTE